MKNTTIVPVALIPTDPSQPITVIDIDNTLQSMYEHIDCDIVERVALNGVYKACLWVDEEAILNGSEMNVRASCLAGRPIYGNAIMAGEDSDGNIVPLSLNCPKKFFDFLEEESIRFLQELIKEAMQKGQI
jgi:hypothetical protein